MYKYKLPTKSISTSILGPKNDDLDSVNIYANINDFLICYNVFRPTMYTNNESRLLFSSSEIVSTPKMMGQNIPFPIFNLERSKANSVKYIFGEAAAWQNRKSFPLMCKKLIEDKNIIKRHAVEG